MQPESSSYFSSSNLRRSSPSSTSLFVGSPPTVSPARKPLLSTEHQEKASHEPLSRPQYHASSFKYHDSFSTSSDSTADQSEDSSEDEDDGGISFPTYGIPSHRVDDDEVPLSPQSVSTAPTSSNLSTPANTPDVIAPADDTEIKQQPSRHVDYLSHDWREEDIWASWKHIVANRGTYGSRSRFENASWRTWAKQKNRLKTVSPETLNWLKDCDVTWLYGPLQTASSYNLSEYASEPQSRLSKNNSFLNKKPILKKRSMSEVMLQKSISASSLLKQAAASVQSQQAHRSALRIPQRPMMAGRGVSDFVSTSIPSRTISRDTTDCSSRSTSGLVTPDGDHSERRHIRFHDTVEQCIAVDAKNEDEEEEEEWAAKPQEDEDSSSDDGVVMMKSSTKKRTISRNHSRNSFTAESKTIAMLPSTTLKYRTDSPETGDHPSHSVSPYYRSSKLSPSPSQETLRPSRPSANFLIDDDDDEAGMAWDPSGAFDERRDSASPLDNGKQKEEVEEPEPGGLRRTASGMFMPYEDDEDAAAAGLIGKVVDTVNTAKDIAHVIWNVGWRR
ncbi:hypothetical protein K402DRAFT_326531 [Aulographum hederae CBS 113979]|uniref:Nitrogen regulatory protein areA GATA-like domain-containing protein n=1 Tax=Aulographum hederae CBS 113979 TaxID=1176131 RepID=A0A6G1H9H6_9PEZI|nr:hypothetical protein K402DRAFT_326531 [Aulographum hederae CBS 113979]